MKGKWLGFGVLVVLAAGLLNAVSCGRDQQLVSIQIQPTVETIGASNIPVADDAGAQVQLRALGSYIHPPVTKDITSQVTWASSDAQMFTVSSAGMLTATGQSCGSTAISATVTTNTSSGGISSKGALVTGYMTGNVICFTATAGIPITVSFAGTGSGTVNSSPAGLSCFSTATNCNGEFTSGSTVQLTAAPNGAFGGWGGPCSSISGNGLICTIDNLTGPVALTATFN